MRADAAEPMTNRLTECLHLKWANSLAACLFLRASDQAKQWLARREKKYGKARALGALAARLGRAVYHLLRKHQAFDVKRFFAS